MDSLLDDVTASDYQDDDVTKSLNFARVKIKALSFDSTEYAYIKVMLLLRAGTFFYILKDTRIYDRYRRFHINTEYPVYDINYSLPNKKRSGAKLLGILSQRLQFGGTLSH